MRQGNRFRWYRVGVGLVVVCATAAVARPDALAHADLDFWNLPTLNQEIEDGAAAGETFESASSAALRRIALKDEIVRDLIEGDIDLLGAAAQFRNLNAVDLDFLQRLRAQYPRRTDQERVCRNVIDYAMAVIGRRPDKAEILQRLESEYTRFHQSQFRHPA